MSELKLIESCEIKLEHSEYRAYFFDAKCGSRRVDIYFSGLGLINVCCHNASHKAHRGLGRAFRSIVAALSAYKSPEVKAIIRAGALAVLEHWRNGDRVPGRHELMIEICEVVERGQGGSKVVQFELEGAQ